MLRCLASVEACSIFFGSEPRSLKCDLLVCSPPLLTADFQNKIIFISLQYASVNFFWEITLTFGSTHADAVPRDRAAAESSANSLELRAKNCEGVKVGRFVCVCVWFFSWFHFRGPMGLWPGGQAKCLPHMRPEKLIRRRDSCGQPFWPMRSEVPVFFLGGLGVETSRFCVWRVVGINCVTVRT